MLYFSAIATLKQDNVSQSHLRIITSNIVGSILQYTPITRQKKLFSSEPREKKKKKKKKKKKSIRVPP